MAAVMFKSRSGGTLKLKNIISLVNNLKCDGVRCGPLRFHHVATAACRNYTQISRTGVIAISLTRPASTGVLLDNAASRTATSESVSSSHILSNEHKSGEVSGLSVNINNTESCKNIETVNNLPKVNSSSEDAISNNALVNGDINTANNFMNGEIGTASNALVNGDLVTASNSLVNGDISTANITAQSAPVLYKIPEPPPIPEEVIEVVQNLPLTGEPTFASLGLGGWSPVGIVQNCMEFLHIGCSLPWWTSIMIGTCVVRIIIFPLVILAQRNAARMTNNLPQLQILQLKMTEARQTGNQLEAARYAQELVMFMKEKQLNPMKNMLVPLAQAPLFISFFMGLRGMSNVPVDSMRTGGLFWFTDLTVPDQYYLLPIVTSVTMWITIEVGADTAKLSAANMQTMKYVLRALPIIIVPFTINFPGAILCYWVSTNFISLIQVGFLKIPAVREYFKIEATVKHNPDSLPVKTKPFVKGLKDSWTNMKITKELEERQRLDELQFQRAGRGPVQKTYKYDPTKQRSSMPATEGIAAKKRDR